MNERQKGRSPDVKKTISLVLMTVMILAVSAALTEKSRRKLTVMVYM